MPYSNHLHYVTGESKIIHWFAQHGDGMKANEKFTHLPLGFNCYEHHQGLVNIFGKFQMIKSIIATGNSSDSELNELAKQIIPNPKHLAHDDPLRDYPIIDDSKWLLMNYDTVSDQVTGT